MLFFGPQTISLILDLVLCFKYNFLIFYHRFKLWTRLPIFHDNYYYILSAFSYIVFRYDFFHSARISYVPSVSCYGDERSLKWDVFLGLNHLVRVAKQSKANLEFRKAFNLNFNLQNQTARTFQSSNDSKRQF